MSFFKTRSFALLVFDLLKAISRVQSEREDELRRRVCEWEWENEGGVKRVTLP